MEEQKVNIEDIQNFISFVALETYINNIIEELEKKNKKLLDDYKGFVSEIWNNLGDDLEIDPTGEAGCKNEKEVIKAIKKYTLQVIKKKAKQLDKIKNDN